MPAVWLTWARSARDTPTAANVRAYAQIVRERSLLRRLIEAGRANRLRRSSARKVCAARDLVDKAEQLVFEIAEQGAARARRRGSASSAMLPPLIDKIDEWHTNPDKLRGLATRLHRVRPHDRRPAAR